MMTKVRAPWNDPCAQDHGLARSTTIYRICVEGLLDRKWMAWFHGFTLAQDGANTTLEGSVPDQAALFGLLACIRDLGLPLISLQRLDQKIPAEE